MPWKAGGARGPGGAGGPGGVGGPGGTGGTGGAADAGVDVTEAKGDRYVWFIPSFPADTFSLSVDEVGEEWPEPTDPGRNDVLFLATCFRDCASWLSKSVSAAWGERGGIGSGAGGAIGCRGSMGLNWIPVPVRSCVY